ncbi:MAG: helix-turn-helix domain-containing protein [Proteobacteria bacterium]|nr:helix-turn-helix domain-containing protein [Pseudomonadota bacterium]
MEDFSANDRVLESCARLVGTIVAQFGTNCQATLYDMRGGTPSLVATAGSVMKPKLGSPLPARLAERLMRNDRENTGRLLFTSTAPDGRRLSSSITSLSGAGGELIGYLCIDLCIEHLIASIDLLQNFCNMDPGTKAGAEPPSGEGDVISMVDAIITEVLGQHGATLSGKVKSDRMKIVAALDQKGVFLIKGAVELIAQRLNVSKFTLYNDLDQLKAPEETASLGGKRSSRRQPRLPRNPTGVS